MQESSQLQRNEALRAICVIVNPWPCEELQACNKSDGIGVPFCLCSVCTMRICNLGICGVRKIALVDGVHSTMEFQHMVSECAFTCLLYQFVNSLLKVYLSPWISGRSTRKFRHPLCASNNLPITLGNEPNLRKGFPSNVSPTCACQFFILGDARKTHACTSFHKCYEPTTSCASQKHVKHRLQLASLSSLCSL